MNEKSADITYVRVLCPYCEVEVRPLIKPGLNVVACNCGEQFLIKTETELKVRIFKLEEVTR